MKKSNFIWGLFISIILISCNQTQDENQNNEGDEVVCICNPDDCKEGKCDPKCKMAEKGSCHNSDKKNCSKKCDTKECPKEKCEKVCDTKECPKEKCEKVCDTKECPKEKCENKDKSVTSSLELKNEKEFECKKLDCKSHQKKVG